MRNLKIVLEELEVGYSMPLQPVFLQSPPSWAGVSAMTGKEDLGNTGNIQPDILNKAPGPSLRESGGIF